MAVGLKVEEKELSEQIEFYNDHFVASQRETRKISTATFLLQRLSTFMA